MEPRVEESYPAHNESIDAWGRNTSAEIHYIVFDAEDENAALKAVYAYAPRSIDGSTTLKEIEISERLDEFTFSVTATYESGDSSGNNLEDNNDNEEEEEEASLSFSCGGGTSHVTTAYAQECLFGGADAGVAIGWNGKGGNDMEIAGVDVPSPEFHETYTKRLPVSKLTTAYRKKVGNLIGKVNKTPFKGWKSGEVMFVNISFSANKGDKEVVVTFEFSIRPNENTVLWGVPVSKKGFDYLWSMPYNELVSGKPAVKPKAVFRAQVVQYADFSVLGV